MTTPATERANPDPTTIWTETKQQLRLQMAQATYDSIIAQSHIHQVNGEVWTIAVANHMAKEWLDNRLRPTVQRTLSNIATGPVTVEFIVSNGIEPLEAEVEAETETIKPADLPLELREIHQTIDQKAAVADYVKAFFGRGGLGYSQQAHHTSQYWMQVLGVSFHLYKFLESFDTRPYNAIAPNFWTPVNDRFNFQRLAEHLNYKKARVISGGVLECGISRDGRNKHNDPLTSSDNCCHSHKFKYLRYKNHPQQSGVVMCQHWSEGLLEVLRRHHLIKVEVGLPAGRNLKIQTWRMLPLLTPYQIENYLNDTMQADYRRWLEKNAKHFALDYDQWCAITEPSLIPLMPDYDQVKISDNLAQRKPYLDFMADAVLNQKYLPCMGDIQCQRDSNAK